jgi:hypothetical protein
MTDIGDLDTVVRQSLESIAAELSSGTWKGRREREIVSLFCFGHLLSKCRPGSILHDPTQICVETPVPQIAGPGQRKPSGKRAAKEVVCKDIVIWPRPRMVCWDDTGKGTVRPLSVIQWKHDQGGVSKNDTSWLQEFSQRHGDFAGFAIATNGRAESFALSCTRVFLGQLVQPWMRIAPTG